MNRILVAVVIGTILALGAYFAVRLNNNGSEGAEPPAEGEVVVTDGSAVPRTIERAGQRIQLNPIVGQEALLVSEREADVRSAQPATVVTEQAKTAETQSQTATSPPATPIPPTAVPQATQVPVVVTGNCGQTTTRDHTVAAGDTLYSLTQAYTTSEIQLAEYGITQASMVVGNVLKVPTTNCTCTSGRSHIVTRGQNVFRLAIQYGTTKEEIQRLNGLDASYLISIGQVLCLP